MLLLDSAGKERMRLEAYLPHNDFRAALKNGLGRIALVQKKYTAKPTVNRLGQRGKDGHPENLLVRRRQSRTGAN